MSGGQPVTGNPHVGDEMRIMGQGEAVDLQTKVEFVNRLTILLHPDNAGITPCRDVGRGNDIDPDGAVSDGLAKLDGHAEGFRQRSQRIGPKSRLAYWTGLAVAKNGMLEIEFHVFARDPSSFRTQVAGFHPEAG